MRRRGRSVALLGADGAGKSTLAAALNDALAPQAATVYMGLYQERRGPRRPTGLKLASLVWTRWSRWVRGQGHQLRGRTVIYDRYAVDALLEPARALSWTGRCRRWMLARACPRPDVLILLDAPGAVLAARTGQDAAILEDRRQRYLRLQDRVSGLMLLDATRAVDELLGQVLPLLVGRERAGTAS